MLAARLRVWNVIAACVVSFLFSIYVAIRSFGGHALPDELYRLECASDLWPVLLDFDSSLEGSGTVRCHSWTIPAAGRCGAAGAPCELTQFA